MTVDNDTTLFFDASCLIAAAGSPSGGSSFLLSVCSRGFLAAVVSQPVLLEAERNVAGHFGEDATNRYERILATIQMKLVSTPSSSRIRLYESIAGEKDAHVVAAAVLAEAEFLITLDKRLEAQVNQVGLSVRAISPGEFIKSVLIHHRDYPSMR